MVGREFEEEVALFLRRKGHKILARNFYSRWGELDIVSRKGRDIFFVEVRARKKGSVVSARESIDYYKRRKIVSTALYYISSYRNMFKRGDWRYHFTVAAVEDGEISIIWDAFSVDEFGL